MVAMAVWGINLSAVKVLTTTLDIMVVACSRMMVAVVALTAIVLVTRQIRIRLRPSIWLGLVGCGALMEHDARHAEIKSMRSALAHRGRGAGAAMLAFIIAEARKRGYARLSLETGSAEPFAPSRALYARFGFRECPPFADYIEDPHSVFMTLAL